MSGLRVNNSEIQANRGVVANALPDSGLLVEIIEFDATKIAVRGDADDAPRGRWFSAILQSLLQNEGAHGRQVVRDFSKFSRFVASGGLCIASRAETLFACTAVRDSPEWLRTAGSDQTFEPLCRGNGRPWRQCHTLP